MTIASLLIGTFVSQVLFVIAKILFFNSLNMENMGVVIAFYVVLVLITIAVARRMGTLNYFESIFLAIVWLLITLFTDFVVTTAVLGRDVYSSMHWWIGVLIIPLAVFVFHKKLHIEARKG